MTNSLFKRNIVTIKELTLTDFELIFSTTEKIKQGIILKTLIDKIIAHCFFEPSTRTRLSFETAALKLGANNIGFANCESLSVQKGESLSDTLRMLDAYADLIILRHTREGAAMLATEVVNCPVINAGDGANQHPTQALIDLFSIRECQQKVNGLSIALIGDLKYGRAIHSLIQACSLYDVRFYLVSSEALSLPLDICDNLKKRGIRFSFHRSIEDVINKVDILYLTRIQQERFNGAPYQPLGDQFILTTDLLKQAKPNLKIFHPLPRLNELPLAIDQTTHAYYFQQANNGVAVRQALLTLILNESLP